MTGYGGANRLAWLQSSRDGAMTNYIGDPTDTAAWINYWPHGVPYAYTLGNGVTHAASFNHQLQQSESYDALNNTNDPTHILFVSCLNWGDTAHPVITDKCSFPSSSADNGNLLQADEAFGGPAYAQQALGFHQAFSYDGLNRLTSVADSGGWTRSFNYDAYGNLWEGGAGNVALAGNTPQSNVYNSHNQIGLDCTQPGTSYDCAGNLLVANGNTLAYNANGQVVSTTGSGIGTVTYLYDGNGNRVAKQTSAGTTLYVYDAQGQLAAEYSTVAQSAPQCGTCYLSVDHLGSTRLVTDATGNVISRHDFLPFGEEIGPNQGGRDGNLGSGADAINQKFTGKERDSESQLDYFGARYYGSALGRWTSVDPAFESEDVENPQTWNRYTYVYNNPMWLKDSDGRCPQCLPALGVGVAGGAIAAGSTAFYDWYTSGTVNTQDVAASFAGGFISSGLPVLTLGTSLVAEAGFGTIAAVGIGSNVSGGVVTRSLDSADANTSPFDPTSLTVDAITGGGGALIGNGVEILIKRDFSPLHPPIRNFGTQAYSAANRVFRNRLAQLDQVARAAAIGIGTGISNAFSTILNAFYFQVPLPAPPATPKFGAQSTFIPCAEGDVNCGR